MSVCVIIAAYNAQGTIARAVASALAQAEVSEVFVIDDASPDATIDAAKTADDGSGRLIILRQPQNAGPSAARNKALEKSNAAWLTVLDSDDFFLEGRIKGLLAYADNADLIADNMWQVSENNVEGPRKSLLDPAPNAPQPVNFEQFVRSNVTQKGRQRGELGFIKPLMRAEFFKKHQIRYQEHLRLGEDFELYARALGLGARMVLVPAQGYVSVVREGSLSGRHSETDLQHLRDCDLALASTLPLSSSEKDALRQHYLSIDCRYQWRMLILAVKRRDPLAMLRTFLRPWPVPYYVASHLAQQIWLRGTGRKPA